MLLRVVACTLLLLSSAEAGFGALALEHATLPTGPLQFLLTKEEIAQWRTVATDAEAERFLELFWARRDPTPQTAANEFRRQIEERVRTADESYGTPRIRGAASPRGKVFVLLGAPHQKTGTALDPASGTAGRSPRLQPRYVDSKVERIAPDAQVPAESWIYEQASSAIAYGQPRLEFNFRDPSAANQWTMERTPGTDSATIFPRIARTYVTQPDMTAVPTYLPVPEPAAAMPVHRPLPAPHPEPTVTGTAMRSSALRAAVDTARTKKALPQSLFLTYDQFTTGEGEPFVSVQLYAPRSARLDGGMTLTLFGAVETVEGVRVAELEEAGTLRTSGRGVMLASSLIIPPGHYVGIFGLARGDEVLAMVGEPLHVLALDSAAPSVSRLLLSNDVTPLRRAQQPKEPFAFAGIQFVPKGDRTFADADELSWLIELRNPGTRGTDLTPRISRSLSLSGKASNGTPVRFKEAHTPVEVEPWDGNRGHYMMVGSVPPATLHPGTYTITIQVKDLLLGKSYDLRESFRVVP